jgi:hypothetical protein
MLICTTVERIDGSECSMTLAANKSILKLFPISMCAYPIGLLISNHILYPPFSLGPKLKGLGGYKPDIPHFEILLGRWWYHKDAPRIGSFRHEGRRIGAAILLFFVPRRLDDFFVNAVNHVQNIESFLATNGALGRTAVDHKLFIDQVKEIDTSGVVDWIIQ